MGALRIIIDFPSDQTGTDTKFFGIDSGIGGNPMSLTPEQIQQVAHLARLELRPEQLAPYAGQLSSILEMVDQLSQAETEAVSPMAHPLDMVQRLRADAVTATDQRDRFQALAPQAENGLYVVPKVIE
ncbi:MAG: Asp-tRNA(Asn)/Glu-tRNA(Gln) amidotransferase subunit GatC [Pseudomonadota bacterium]|mgnify:CR=1 FL=1|jgi:aspartyl-tRNA(Asn)/glutamyl-tRNA(Gln) amidotransferase subunit C|nr:Asp-tRNA(Asn)/Glu-tRNA(Gln) amidotransferase subunit GatC [Pseudomonadota bacterium]